MVVLIGNLTRDPELRYTPAGHAVASFGLATNRSWKTAEGERRDEAEFHNVVTWNKLAEICSQFLAKGRRVYIQGRLQTRAWEGKDGARRSRTEVIADDMVILDSQRGGGVVPPDVNAAAEVKKEIKEEIRQEVKAEAEPPAPEVEVQKKNKSAKKEDVSPKDMPF